MNNKQLNSIEFSLNNIKLILKKDLSLYTVIGLLHKESIRKLNLKPLAWLITIVYYFFYSLSANAALDATSVNAIHGTSPYFTFDDGKSKLSDTSELLSITLSNGTIYTKSNNPSTVNNPIELPESGQSMAEVGMVVPVDTKTVSSSDTTQTVELQDLIGEPYNYARDDDGDEDLTATGSLSVIITDVNGNKIARNEPLNACNTPYKVTLTSSNASLSTPYGLPRSASLT